MPMPNQYAQAMPAAGILAPMSVVAPPPADAVTELQKLVDSTPGANVSLTIKSKKQEAGQKKVATTKPGQLSAAPDDLMAILPQLTGGGPAKTQAMIDQLLTMAGQIQPDPGYMRSMGQMGQAAAAIPAQTDLTPLAALVDQWTGSQFAKSYQAPQNAQSQQAFGLLQGMVGEQKAAEQKKLEALAKATGMQLDFEKMKSDQDMERRRFATMMNKTETGKIPEQDAITKISAGQDSLRILEGLKPMVGSKLALFGPVKGAASLLPNVVNWNEEQKSMDAVLRNAAQMVGKAMEGGVLRKEDEIKYRKMLPNLQDSPEVAQFKLEYITAMTRNSLLNYMEDQVRGRRDMSGYMDQIQQYQADKAKFKMMDKFVKTKGDDDYEVDPKAFTDLEAMPEPQDNQITFDVGKTFATSKGTFKYAGGNPADPKSYQLVR
jgi:hypothetical protein